MLKKKWLWILIIVLVLVAGAGGYYYYSRNLRHYHPRHPNASASHADRGCPAG